MSKTTIKCTYCQSNIELFPLISSNAFANDWNQCSSDFFLFNLFPYYCWICALFILKSEEKSTFYSEKKKIFTYSLMFIMFACCFSHTETNQLLHFKIIIIIAIRWNYSIKLRVYIQALITLSVLCFIYVNLPRNEKRAWEDAVLFSLLFFLLQIFINHEKKRIPLASGWLSTMLLGKNSSTRLNELGMKWKVTINLSFKRIA